MSTPSRQGRSLSRPQHIPRAPNATSPSNNVSAASHGNSFSARSASIARLGASPGGTLSSSHTAVPQVPIPEHLSVSGTTPTVPLPGATTSGSLPIGQSALAKALDNARGNSPHRGTPPLPGSPNLNLDYGEQSSQGGVRAGFDSTGELISPSPRFGGIEDPEIVRRHLVTPPVDESSFHRPEASEHRPSALGSPALGHRPSISAVDAPDLDEFSSLQLPGGDIHRQVYRWAEEQDAQSRGVNKYRRTQSFHGSRAQPENDMLDIQNIKVPGGFRRNFLRRTALSPAPTSRYGTTGDGDADSEADGRAVPQPVMLTNNFIEFLTLYGHFAGEELEDDDDETESDDYFSQGGDEAGERSALLTPRTPGTRKKQRIQRSAQGKNTPMGAALLLLKSFVGTGVLFLPRAFLNGGMLFSGLVLIGVAALSYYCFVLLVSTRLRVEASFGDMGGILYGRTMRALILGSIVLSQIGFVAAYIVFVSENLQAFVLAVSKCQTWINIKWMVLMQMVLFLPLSLIRDISKLGFTALIADVFILLGLVYLYYFDISTIVSNHGPADIVNFNPSHWTLFIGTAIFTFEGIGLIIPIQESMRKPSQFPPVLGIVMIIITVVFTSMGALSYAAYGSATKTVVILNLPQDSKFVNGVQFLYSLAILLSTPLQLFPAIRILETELFTRSGKFNRKVKWEKNVFRFFLVMGCAMIAWVGANDLDKFVSLVGSFACVPLVYVYPPLLHLKAVAKTRLHKISDIALSIFGFFVMAYATSLTIQSWASSSGAPSGPEHCDL